MGLIRGLSVCAFTLFEVEFLKDQQAKSHSNFILSITGVVGQGCIRFSGRLDKDSGFHGNGWLTLIYNGEMLWPL